MPDYRKPNSMASPTTQAPVRNPWKAPTKPNAQHSGQLVIPRGNPQAPYPTMSSPAMGRPSPQRDFQDPGLTGYGTIPTQPAAAATPAPSVRQATGAASAQQPQVPANVGMTTAFAPQRGTRQEPISAVRPASHAGIPVASGLTGRIVPTRPKPVASGTDYRQAPPSGETDYRKVTPSDGQDYRKAVPSEGQDYRKVTPPSEGQDYRKAVPSEGQDYRKAAPSSTTNMSQVPGMRQTHDLASETMGQDYHKATPAPSASGPMMDYRATGRMPAQQPDTQQSPAGSARIARTPVTADEPVDRANSVRESRPVQQRPSADGLGQQPRQPRNPSQQVRIAGVPAGVRIDRDYEGTSGRISEVDDQPSKLMDAALTLSVMLAMTLTPFAILNILVPSIREQIVSLPFELIAPITIVYIILTTSAALKIAKAFGCGPLAKRVEED